MKYQGYRLALTVALFVGWLSYLGYLVATRPLTESGDPLVLSRPQFLVSPLDVVARVEGPEEAIVIEEILWPLEGSPVKVGDRFKIPDIEKCHAMPRHNGRKPVDDFSGPGSYIIPLRPASGEGRGYEIVTIPNSPGFNASTLELNDNPPVRIYRSTPETRAQYNSCAKIDLE